MGGNAFKDGDGNQLTTEISREQVEPTLDHFRRAVLVPLSIANYEKIGSTGKKAKSGDMDVVVSHGESDAKEFKNSLVTGIKKMIGANRVKPIGSLVTVMYPIVNPDGNLTDQSVQIDIAIVRDVSHAAWLMSGGGDDVVRGVYRNLLLSYIANVRSSELTEEGVPTKISLSFPGGLTVKRDNKVVISGVTDPQKILSLLGLSVKPEDITSFENLVTKLTSSKRTSHYLNGFSEYISDYAKSDPKGSARAFSFLNDNIGIVETIRRFVSSLLS